MNKQLLILIIAGISLPLAAQETNRVDNSVRSSSEEALSEADMAERVKNPRENRGELKKRQLRLMEKALNEIGVTEEQRQQIIALQEVHMDKMKANWQRMNKARRELSRLQDSGASMEELNAAIEEVSLAQTEQLQILVLNRREMENILGKEKNDLLMQKANEYFRKHGRRPGAGLPPRPNTPPIPGEKQAGNQLPPTPESGSESVPPIPH